MPIELPSDIAKDIRQPIVGDSFGWDAIEPAAAKKSIVIHATASDAPGEDGFTMADYHVNRNGWGGIGVHFVVTKDNYPGRAGFTDPGAHVQYVGDLLTWRAGTLNQNPGRVHIEISGLFTPGNGIPSPNQLRAARALIDFLLAPNNLLPSLNFYSQVTYHNAVPGQNTECPGWQHPSFQAWFAYLQGGAFPDALYAPPPPPQPNATLGQGGGTPIPVTVAPTPDPVTRNIQREGAYVINYADGTRLKDLPLNTPVLVQTYVDYNGVANALARTVYAVQHNLTNGVPIEFFDPPTGQPSGTIPVNTPPIASPAPNVTLVGDAVASNVTDAQLQAATVPLEEKKSVLELIKELFAEIAAKFIRRKV